MNRAPASKWDKLHGTILHTSAELPSVAGMVENRSYEKSVGMLSPSSAAEVCGADEGRYNARAVLPQGAFDVQSIRASQTADPRAKQTHPSGPTRRSARVNSRLGDGYSHGSALSLGRSGGEVSEPAPFGWTSSACGCATAWVAAENLGRRWIGVDISPKAVELVNIRLQQSTGDLFHNRLVTARTDIPKRTDIDAPVPYRLNKHVLFGQQGGRCNSCRSASSRFAPLRWTTSSPRRRRPGQHREPTAALRPLQSGQERPAAGGPARQVAAVRDCYMKLPAGGIGSR